MKKSISLLLAILVFTMFLLPTSILAEQSSTAVNGMLGFSPPEGTSITASRVYQNNIAANVLDGNLETSWNAGLESGTLELTFPTKVSISKIQIAASSVPRGSKYSFTFKGLVNGSWVSINNPGDGDVTSTAGGSKIFEPFQVNPGSYEGLMIEAKNDSFWIGISELTLINEQTPEAPSNLTAIAGDQSVTLTWDEVEESTSYIVKRAVTEGGPYSTLATKLSETTFTDINVKNGTTYYYVVTAVRDNIESNNSIEVQATPQASTATLNIEAIKDKVLLNETFTVQTVLENVYSIYAEDFTIQYDKTRFQLIKVEAVDHMGVLHNEVITDDTIRLITASLGKAHGINDKGTLVNLTFKAVGLGKGKVDVIKGKIADNGTTETTLSEENLGETEIEVIAGNFTLKHLGLLGYHYNEDKSILSDDLASFLGTTGNISEIDLTELTKIILANPEYDFNK